LVVLVTQAVSRVAWCGPGSMQCLWEVWGWSWYIEGGTDRSLSEADDTVSKVMTYYLFIMPQSANRDTYTHIWIQIQTTYQYTKENQ